MAGGGQGGGAPKLSGANGQPRCLGFGLSVLLVGSSGTGKTLAADVLALDLRRDLHRIDLNAVVSKYIGQTEKNLRRVFAVAEQCCFSAKVPDSVRIGAVRMPVLRVGGPAQM